MRLSVGIEHIDDILEDLDQALAAARTLDGCMTGPAASAACSTQRVVLFDRDDPLVLESGAPIAPVEVAFETYGTLDADRSNVVFVCHALTGDAHAAGHHGDPARSGVVGQLHRSRASRSTPTASS